MISRLRIREETRSIAPTVTSINTMIYATWSHRIDLNPLRQPQPDAARADEAENGRLTGIGFELIERLAQHHRQHLRQHAEAQCRHLRRAGRADAVHLALVGVLDRLGVQLGQHAGVGDEDRQDAGDRPEAHRADEHQRPDELIETAEHVEHPARDEPEHAARHDVARAEEAERQCDDGCEQRAQERHRHGFQHRLQDLDMVPACELRPVEHEADDHPEPIKPGKQPAEVEQPVQIAEPAHNRDRKRRVQRALRPGRAEGTRQAGAGASNIGLGDGGEPDRRAHRSSSVPMSRARMRSDARSISMTAIRIRMAIALTSS